MRKPALQESKITQINGIIKLTRTEVFEIPNEETAEEMLRRVNEDINRIKFAQQQQEIMLIALNNEKSELEKIFPPKR